MVPVIVVDARLTGTTDARSCASVTGPVTATDAAILTGWVAGKNVPVTGVLGIVAMLTGCVACQNVPVTATLPVMVVDARLTGTAVARNCASVIPVTARVDSATSRLSVLALISASVASVLAPVGSGSDAADTANVPLPALAVTVPVTPTFHVPLCVTAPMTFAPVASAGSVVSETGCVAWKKVPVTGVVGTLVTCTAKVPAFVTKWDGTDAMLTGTGTALSCASVRPAVDTVPLTGTGVARSCASVRPGSGAVCGVLVIVLGVICYAPPPPPLLPDGGGGKPPPPPLEPGNSDTGKGMTGNGVWTICGAGGCSRRAMICSTVGASGNSGGWGFFNHSRAASDAC